MRLEDIAAELYGLDPAEFVTTRDARVKAARESGDRPLATAIGALRRPTVAAWAVNLLARADSEAVGELLEVADALAQAQRRLSADRLRELTVRRREIVNALVRRAAELAAGHGRPLPEPVLREIGRTLHAALAEPAVALQVREGTLAAATSYEGFGPAGPALTVVPEPDDSRSNTAARSKTRASRPESPTVDSLAPAEVSPPAPTPAEEARRELDDALADLESDRAATESARTELTARSAEVAELDTRIAALRTELTRAEDRRRTGAAAERAARDAVYKAERRAERSRRRVEQARSRRPES